MKEIYHASDIQRHKPTECHLRFCQLCRQLSDDDMHSSDVYETPPDMDRSYKAPNNTAHEYIHDWLIQHDHRQTPVEYSQLLEMLSSQRSELQLNPERYTLHLLGIGMPSIFYLSIHKCKACSK